jgi:ADP-ribose pyrophosphatase
MAKSNSDYAEFTTKDVEVIEKKVAFKGYFQVDEYTMRHKKHEGGWSAPINREIFERGHASGMLLYDPKLDIVVMIEQFRPGAFAAGFNPWLLEIPAGIIDKGQTPESVAINETTEETGCTAKRIEFIADYLVSPGGSSESLHLYCVEVDSTEALEYAGLAEEGEHIRVLKVPALDTFKMLDTGEMHNSTGIIAIMWLKLHRDNLRKKWCD